MVQDVFLCLFSRLFASLCLTKIFYKFRTSLGIYVSFVLDKQHKHSNLQSAVYHTKMARILESGINFSKNKSDLADLILLSFCFSSSAQKVEYCKQRSSYRQRYGYFTITSLILWLKNKNLKLFYSQEYSSVKSLVLLYTLYLMKDSSYKIFYGKLHVGVTCFSHFSMGVS